MNPKEIAVFKMRTDERSVERIRVSVRMAVEMTVYET